MPSSVSALLATANLEPAGAVRWGEPVPEQQPGVYLVALTDDPASTTGVTSAPLSATAFEDLLTTRPELRLDDARPTAEALAERLAAFWLPDEPVLYCGRAGSSLRRRVDQYHRTPLGARKPHAGGWWLKTLASKHELWVHWAPTPDNTAAEKLMLGAFAAGVTDSHRLHDLKRVAPFANLRCGDDLIKRHGIRGATGD